MHGECSAVPDGPFVAVRERPAHIVLLMECDGVHLHTAQAHIMEHIKTN